MIAQHGIEMIFVPEPSCDDWYDFDREHREFAGYKNTEFFTYRPWEYQKAIQISKLSERDIILDAGGGMSYFAAYVCRFVKKAYIVDNGSFAYYDRWYKTLFSFADYLSGKLIVIREDAQSLPFRDGYFDKVFTFSVLEHFVEGEDTRACEEIYRVLKPGGMFLGTVDFNPNSKSLGDVDRTYDYDTFRHFILAEVGFRLLGEKQALPLTLAAYGSAITSIALFFALRK